MTDQTLLSVLRGQGSGKPRDNERARAAVRPLNPAFFGDVTGFSAQKCRLRAVLLLASWTYRPGLEQAIDTPPINPPIRGATVAVVGS
jgi:hypothetical protein